jgi:hypothetical protein
MEEILTILFPENSKNARETLKVATVPDQFKGFQNAPTEYFR